MIVTFCGYTQTPTSLKNDTTLSKIDFKKFKLVGLPCPNSSTKAGGPWSYEEAEKRKNEIYDMAVTKEYRTWSNPTSGGSIHINKNDEILVYQFPIGIFQKVDSLGLQYQEAPKDKSVIVKVNELWYNVSGVPLGSNEISILITSEINLQKSQTIKEILEVLGKPGVQIHYLTKRN